MLDFDIQDFIKSAEEDLKYASKNINLCFDSAKYYVEECDKKFIASKQNKILFNSLEKVKSLFEKLNNEYLIFQNKKEELEKRLEDFKKDKLDVLYLIIHYLIDTIVEKYIQISNLRVEIHRNTMIFVEEVQKYNGDYIFE